MSKLVVFHGNCRDGFCAAWVAWNHGWRDAVFHPAMHGEPPPDVRGKDVLVLDFSWPRGTMDQMAADAKSLLVLDHHRTAEAELRDAPYAVFDMERSGAGLAWDYLASRGVRRCMACLGALGATTADTPRCHCKSPVSPRAYLQRPWIVNYVEDRDLWRWQLHASKPINAYIAILPFDFQEWDAASSNGTITTIEKGEVALAKTRQYVAEVIKNARPTRFESYAAMIVNAPQVDISEVLHELLQPSICMKCHGTSLEGDDGGIGDDEPCSKCGGAGRTSVDIAIGWWQRADGLYQYSLRSTVADVSELAKRYGGGGHRAAAGFQVAVKLTL